MNKELLEKAVKLSLELDYVLVATADQEGVPHMAAAEKLLLASEDTVAVTSWCCPATVANLHDSPRIAIVVWNPVTDIGYQLLGQIERVEDLNIMDGFAPEIEKRTAIVEVEKQLTVRVEKILNFRYAAHSDMEE